MAGGRRRKTARAQWPRRDYLVDALAHYENMARDAEKQSSWQAAVRAKMQAVAIRSEIDQLDESQQVMELPSSLEDHRTEVLRQVRKLRAAAEASNSFVAASTLLKLEAELVAAEDQRQREAKAGEETRTSDEILATIQDKLSALPDVLKAKVGQGGG